MLRNMFQMSFLNVSQELLVIFDIEEDAILPKLHAAYEFTNHTCFAHLASLRIVYPLASAGREKN